MLSVWIYIAVMFGSIILAFIVAFCFFQIYDTIQKRKLKKQMPTDGEELLIGAKPIVIDQKEVKENERIKFNKYRQFEKLRRVESGKGSSSKPTIIYSGNPGKQQPGDIQHQSTSDNGKDKPNTPKAPSSNRKSISFG